MPSGRRTTLLLGLALIAGCATSTSPSAGTDTPATSPAPVSAPAAATQLPQGSPDGSPRSAGAWTELPDAPFARLEMATAAHDGRIWLAGGLSPTGGALNEVDVLDPASGEWSEGPAVPMPIHHAALVSDGTRLWLLGGYVGDAFNAPSALTWSLEPGATDWTPGPELPAPRAAGAAAWDGERIVYAGGVGAGIVGDVYVLEDGAWTRLGTMLQPREHLAATSDGEGRVWLMGGRIGTLDTNLANVDLVLDDEIAVLEPVPTRRGGVAAFYVPGVGACLSGGEAPDRAYDAVECVDADGAVTSLEPMNRVRHGHGAAVVGEVAYVILGGPEPTLSAHASVESLDIGP